MARNRSHSALKQGFFPVSGRCLKIGNGGRVSDSLVVVSVLDVVVNCLARTVR